MVKVRPSAKATCEIESAMRMLGRDCTWDKLKELTGYDIAVIKAVVRESERKPKKEGVVKKSIEERDAPLFIKEIQQTTGLECIKLHVVKSFEEWALLSPTGVPVMRLVGKGDLLQFAKPIHEPAKVLQGIATHVIESRREARKRKRKND